MPRTIGIRREDKSEWERRVPLVPRDIAALEAQHDLHFLVQGSPIRVYGDDDYRAEGIEISEDLAAAEIVIAVKEIPKELLQADRTYVCFAHVIKGQPYNMPTLARLLELGCSLVDYEKIADERGARKIFFSLHAGHAGTIETLWGLGQRLQHEGIETPLAEIRHAYEYDDLAAAKKHLREIGQRFSGGGITALKRPLIIGIAGYGNVARGCQEILSCLPIDEVAPEDLGRVAASAPQGGAPFVKVVFKEEHLVRPAAPGAAFELQDYYQHPERYVGCFDEHLPHLDLLLNTIYWTERYPRLVTRDWTLQAYGTGRTPRLRVIGDISCDIRGSIEITEETTQPDAPCFVYDVAAGGPRLGVAGVGPVVMAVDNLPCELPRESSDHFSAVLKEMVPDLARADWTAPFERLELPPHLKRAVITHRGELTPDYGYLKTHLPS